MEYVICNMNCVICKHVPSGCYSQGPSSFWSMTNSRPLILLLVNSFSCSSCSKNSWVISTIKLYLSSRDSLRIPDWYLLYPVPASEKYLPQYQNTACYCYCQVIPMRISVPQQGSLCHLFFCIDIAFSAVPPYWLIWIFSCCSPVCYVKCSPSRLYILVNR